MLISVIVPTYKPGPYLFECLDSIYAQTFSKTDYEVLIVLNGCNAPYKSLITDWLGFHKDLNVKLLQTDMAGVSNARNLGLDNSNGEYICFIDDDDRISSTYLEQLYCHAAPDIIPVCRPLSFRDGSDCYEEYYVTRDYDRYHTKGKQPFFVPRRFFNGPVYKLMHKSIIGDRRFDVRFSNGEDSLFMILCSDRYQWVDFADPSCIYYRRVRAGSATAKRRSFLEKLQNEFRRSAIIVKTFMTSPSRYNFRFFARSIIGSAASVLFD